MKDHLSQIIVATIILITMKRLEILWELPNMWHKDTKWANAVGNGTNRLAWPRAATDFHFLLKKVNHSYLWNTIKWNTIKWDMPVHLKPSMIFTLFGPNFAHFSEEQNKITDLLRYLSSTSCSALVFQDCLLWG